MPPFERLYPELYTAVNEALACLYVGASEEAVQRLLQAQVDTVAQIVGEL